MWLAETIDEQRRQRRQLPGSVAFVPTMGALHTGHLALVEAGRTLADHVILSLFVNPTQFGPSEDFDAYPRQMEADLAACRNAEVDGVFAPSHAQMYPPGVLETKLTVPSLEHVFEGEQRPGHFAGVCRVVAKLLNIVQPDLAVFGEKDYQQLVVIRNMVADLNMPVRIEACRTVRESDGLAMSSRNVYLSEEERARAVGLYKALCRAQSMVQEEHETRPEPVEAAMRHVIEAHQMRVDYAVVRHSKTLGRVERIERPPLGDGAVAMVAARLGRVRLIDNLQLAR